MEDIKVHIEEKLNIHLKSFNVQKKIILTQIPKQLSNLGDYSFVVNSLDPVKPISLALTLLGLKERAIKSGEKVKGVLPINSIAESYILVRGKEKAPLVYINLVILPDLKQKYRTLLVKRLIELISKENFAKSDEYKGKIAIVEHTSANPISPLHIGNLRSTIQGDTFARILTRVGFTVFRHFYVNDGGLQIAFTALGYKILKRRSIRPDIKFDAWIGQVYAIMNVFYHTQATIRDVFPGSKKKYALNKQDITQNEKKSKAELAKINELLSKLTQEKENYEKMVPHPKIQLEKVEQKRETLINKKVHTEKLQSSIQKYYSSFHNLKLRFPLLFQILYEEIQDIDLNFEVGKLLREYEKGKNEKIKTQVREMVDWVLDGFKWTLNRYNVHLDSFDFETDITWSGAPERNRGAIRKIRKHTKN